MNWDWRELYSHVVGVAFPIVNSDTSPLVLHPYPPDRRLVYFRYENFWEEHNDCRQVVAEGWSSSTSTDTGWGSFTVKAKNCKRSLLAWHKNTFKNAALEITS